MYTEDVRTELNLAPNHINTYFNPPPPRVKLYTIVNDYLIEKFRHSDHRVTKLLG